MLFRTLLGLILALALTTGQSATASKTGEEL